MQRKSSSKNIIPTSKLFKKDGSYNLVRLKAHLQDEGVLANNIMQQMVAAFTNIIKTESNLLSINGAVTIIGDIHGQYYDFLKVMTKVGDMESSLTGYVLFLGDYVDRGANSVEVMTFIMALKINYPKNVFLLRGNHESRCMTATYNFMREVVQKYNQGIYQSFMSSFDAMPLACLVNNSFFCVHGGISDKLIKIKDINQLDRFKEIPLDGPFCDFIWADPVQETNGFMQKQTMFNSSRQCSIFFGYQLTKKFIETNQVKSIIRAHEVFLQGYQKYCWGNKNGSEFPTVVTVFSAPNYCGVYGNKGAIIKIQGVNFQIKQYRQQVINNKLHNYLEVFQWSVPEVIRVINQFCKAMLGSIFQLYLKQQFPNFKNSSPEDQVAVILRYIKTRTHIMDQQPQQMLMNSVIHKKTDHFGIEKEDKQSLFIRSREYFREEHRAPKH